MRKYCEKPAIPLIIGFFYSLCLAIYPLSCVAQSPSELKISTVCTESCSTDCAGRAMLVNDLATYEKLWTRNASEFVSKKPENQCLIRLWGKPTLQIDFAKQSALVVSSSICGTSTGRDLRVTRVQRTGDLLEVSVADHIASGVVTQDIVCLATIVAIDKINSPVTIKTKRVD